MEKKVEFASNVLFELQNTNNVCYINIPYASLFMAAMKTGAILFLISLVSVNFIVAVILTPAWLMMLYIYYLYWNVMKIYNFKLVSFIIYLIVLNTPFCIIAIIIQKLIINLFRG